jgi:hypothetical protein
VGNTWFKKKLVNKYTWLRDSRINEALMDWVLVDKRLKGRLEDVNVLRSWGGVIGNDPFLVVARMCWKGTKYEKREEEKVRVIRLSELLKKEKTEKYRKLIEEQWRVVRVPAVASIEEQWECFKDTILRTSEEVCELRSVGASGKKSEWWSEEAGLAVREKLEASAKWLQKKDRDSREEYKRKRREANRVIADCKKEANMKWGEHVTNKFKESKKIFWKSVSRRRKLQEKLEVVVKDTNGKYLMKMN